MAEKVDRPKEANAVSSFCRSKLKKLLTGMSLRTILKRIKEGLPDNLFDEGIANHVGMHQHCFVCESKKLAAKELWNSFTIESPCTDNIAEKPHGASIDKINGTQNGANGVIDFSNFPQLIGEEMKSLWDDGQTSPEVSHSTISYAVLKGKIKQMLVEAAESLLAFSGDGADCADADPTTHDDNTLTFVTSTDLTPEQVQSSEKLNEFCTCLHSTNGNLVAFKACRKCLDSIGFIPAAPESKRPISASELLNHVITMLYVCADECDDDDNEPGHERAESVCVENGLQADCLSRGDLEAPQHTPEKDIGRFVAIHTEWNTETCLNGSSAPDVLPESCVVAANGDGQHVTLEALENRLGAIDGAAQGLTNGGTEVAARSPLKMAAKKGATCLKELMLRTNLACLPEKTLLPNGGQFRWVKSVNVANIKPCDLAATKSPPLKDKNDTGVLANAENGLLVSPDAVAEVENAENAAEAMPRLAKSKCKDIINLLVNTNELGADQGPSASPSKSGKPRTPSKKRGDKRNASMRKIVVGYLTTPSCGYEGARPPPRNKGRRAGASKAHLTKKKAIPIPYETHYLCITQTLAKKGWKAYWYRKCRCAKSRQKTVSGAAEAGPSPACSDEESARSRSSSISSSPSNLKGDSPVAETDTPSTSAIEIVITTHNDGELPRDTEDLKPAGSDRLDTATPLKGSISDDKPTVTNRTCGPEVLALGGATLGPRLKRDDAEIVDRRRKLDEALSALKELRKLRCQETFDSLLRPVVFAQSHESVDKQPSALDLVCVDQKTVSKCVDLGAGKVEEIFADKRARSALLLEGTFTDAHARSLSSSKSGGHPYFGPVWNQGKTHKFFEEARFAKPARKITKLKPRFRAAKPSALGMSRLKSLKRAMKLKKPKLAQLLQARRPEDPVPAANAHFNQLLEPELWKVPQHSVSQVVGSLEYLWGEVSDRSSLAMPLGACTPVSRKAKPYGAIAISDKRIELALGALCKDDDIFTFSSKRVTSGRGQQQKNVLLISRKYLTEPRPRRRRHRMDSLNGECPCMQMKPFEFDEPEPEPEPELQPKPEPEVAPSSESPSKILLKLKKVHSGDESDSVTYAAGEVDADLDAAKGPETEPKPAENAVPCADPSAPPEAPSVESSSGDNATIPENLYEITQNLPVEDAVGDPAVLETSMEISSTDDKTQELELSMQDKTQDLEPIDNDSNAEEAPASIDTPQLESLPHSSASRDRASSDEWATPPSSPLDIASAGATSQISTPCAFPQNSALLDTSTPHTGGPDKAKISPPVNDDREVSYQEKLDYEDELHQFLSGVNESSLELLESVLLWCDPEQPPPLQLLISLQEVHNETTEAVKARLRSPDASWSHNEDLHTSARGFLSFDSPEVIRGLSRSKHSPEEAPPAPMSPTESEANFRGSPMSPGCMENAGDHSSNHCTLNLPPNGTAALKTCNVVLEPIDLDSAASGVAAAAAPINESTKTGGATEYHRRLYEKILKNHALNGAYWRSPALATGDQERSRYLRERGKKRKRSEDDDKAADESEEEEASEEESDEEAADLTPSGPKRKRLGRVHYTRIDDQRIEEAVARTWTVDNQEEPVDNGEQAVAKDTSLPDLFKWIQSRRLDLKQVKSWMLKSTAAQPRPLLFPRLVSKRSRMRQEKQRTKSRSRRASSVISSTSTVTSCSDDVKGGKRGMRKKSKDFATSSKSGRWKAISDDEFEALRRQLFHLRHPEYAGRLYDHAHHLEDAPPPSTAPPPPARHAHLHLQRVNEDQVKMSDEPVLDKKAVLGANGEPSSSGVNFSMPAKRRRVFSPCRTPPHDGHQESAPPTYPAASHVTRLFAPSRGGGAGRGRGRGRGARNAKMLASRREVESMEKDQRGPRLNSRFANKHSTEGAFLQRILESGNFDSYV